MARTRFNSLASTLRRAAACCALGAAITLAIAWWSAWRCNWDDPDIHQEFITDPSSPRSESHIGTTELCSPTATRRSWRQEFAGASYGPPDLFMASPRSPTNVVLDSRRRSWPDWGRSPRAFSPPMRIASGIEDARGWPFLALWCEITRSRPTFGVRGGIELPQSTSSPNDATYRALPCRPIWPGLAADTAVFAVPLFVAWSFARLARAHRRVTRGRCPLCAYDLRFDLRAGCSECGWNRPATLLTPAPPHHE